MVAGPLTCDQRPDPTVGAFPAMVPLSEQKVWSAPAFAVVGELTTVTLTVAWAVPHAFETVTW